MTVGAGATAAVRMVPGPRFLRSGNRAGRAGTIDHRDAAGAGAGAGDFAGSADLAGGDDPGAGGFPCFVLQVAQAEEAAECFYRLRW